MKVPWSRGSLFTPRRSRSRASHGFARWAWILFAALVLSWFARRTVNFNMALYEGRRAIDRNEFPAAREAFQRAWSIRPESPIVYDCAGFLFLREQGKDWKTRARDNYIRARTGRLRGNFYVNHVKEARKLLDSGHYAQAEIELEHALLINPQNAVANMLEGHLLYSQGKLGKAIEQYQKALEISSGSAEIKAVLARAQEAKTRGSVPYILDRNGQVLAATDIKTGAPSYPADFWTAHLIGYRSAEHGQAGLEEALGDQLKGNVVTLTIDARLQRIADATLGWQKGAIVVMDPRTGEILACVSHPAYRPSIIDKSWYKIKDNPNDPLKNRALEGLYEPGSIAKIITASAILETRTDISKLFPFKCKGYMMIGKDTFWDWKRHGNVASFNDAFNWSCNMGMGRIAPHLGAASLTQFLRSFGFAEDDHISLELPVAKSRAPLDLETQMDLATTAIGLGRGFRISPLHAAMIASGIANNGVMMAPILIKEIRSVTGEVISVSTPRAYKTMMKKDTAEEVTKMMVGFVQDGIGRKARMIRYHVAGKTGTSGNSKNGLHGWFICFAPSAKPELAMAILCENGGPGHAVAAPLAQRFLTEALR